LLFLFLFSHNTQVRSSSVKDVALFPPALRRPRHRRLFWLLALSVVSGVPFPQSARAQESQTGGLHGTVINSVTREPVAHALVFSGDDRFAAFTDDQGRFEFPLPRSESNLTRPGDGPTFNIGSVQLMARKPGFLQSENSGSDLLQNGVAEEITIALVPESLIIGQVNLPSSNQFDRIAVSIYKRQMRDGRPFWAPAASAATRSNGEFRAANLTAGTYKVFTNELLDRDPLTFDPRGPLYGYPPSYYPGTADFASASAITLEAGKTLQLELSPILHPYYPVKIGITNIPNPGGMEVSVASQGHRGPGYSLGYTGEAIEGMLPNGTYTVEATMQQGNLAASGIVNITVKDAPLNHASLTMLPTGPIPVHIKDERSSNGRESTGVLTMGSSFREQKANVLLQPVDEFDSMGGIYLRPPLKPNDNDLVLENVRPGLYWVRADPYQGYIASAVAGSTDLLRQPLVVGPGGASLPIDIVLRDDGATIEGTVEGMPAAPAVARPGSIGLGRSPQGSAYVYCIPLPDSPGRFAATSVQPEGNFKFQQLPPGAYRVLAFDRQQEDLPYHDAEVMGAYEGKGPVVRLVAGQTEQVRVALISTKE
jgi:hypothetical protein